MSIPTDPRMYDVILAPVITEKATLASEHNKVIFKVAAAATKPQIKEAVEKLFDVKVKAVNTLNRKGKRKAFRGRPGVQGDWPTDDLPLSREQRRELQRLLIARGYNVGEPDGAVGSLTRAAIKEIEAKIGMPQTGRPGEKVLRALKGGRV